MNCAHCSSIAADMLFSDWLWVCSIGNLESGPLLDLLNKQLKKVKGKERKGKEVAVEGEYFVSRAKTHVTGTGCTSGYVMPNAISVVVIVIVYKLK